jgi:hypothetical protein
MQMHIFQVQRSCSHSAHGGVCVDFSKTPNEVCQFLDTVSIKSLNTILWVRGVKRAKLLILSRPHVILSDTEGTAMTVGHAC